jgi:hypothetical protein
MNKFRALLKKILLCFFAGSMALISTPTNMPILAATSQVLTGGASSVLLNISQTTVAQATEFVATVAVNSQAASRGIQFSISFDPRLVSVTSIKEGDYYSSVAKSKGGGTYFVAGELDKKAGILKNVAINVYGAQNTEVSGQGTVAVLTMKSTSSKITGTCPFKLTDVILGSKTSAQIKNTVVGNSQITVTGVGPDVNALVSPPIKALPPVYGKNGQLILPAEQQAVLDDGGILITPIQDFEGDFPSVGWTVSGNPNPTWDNTDYLALTGYKSVWCAASSLDPINAYYSDNMNAGMVYGPLDLSQITSATLSFNYWLYSEQSYDFLGLSFSTDGTTWNQCWSLSGVQSQQQSDWHWLTVDLSNAPNVGDLLGNQSVWIEFTFTSDSSFHLYPGAFLDTVYVVGEGVIAPRVSTNPATNVSLNSATLNGNLANLGTADSADLWFEYGTTPGYGSSAYCGQMTNPESFAAGIASLSPNTTYHFRAKATSSEGTRYGLDQQFTTLSLSPPSVSTGTASNISSTGATLSGILWERGSANPVNVYFDYGLTTSYGSSTLFQQISSTGNFSASISGLIPGTTYHFRARANGDGTACGYDSVFTTLGPPSVTVSSPSAITTSTATLNGNLSTLGSATMVNVRFDYGLNTSYGSSTSFQQMSSIGNFSATIGGLTPGTPYHFRARADGYGTSYSGDLQFTTPPSLSVTTLSPDNVTDYFAETLKGNVQTSVNADTWFEWWPVENPSLNYATSHQSRPQGDFSIGLNFLGVNHTFTFVAKAQVGSYAVTGLPISFITKLSPAPSWDIVQSGGGDLLDLIQVGNWVGRSGPHGWVRMDATDDGTISVLDLILVGNGVGQSWSRPVSYWYYSSSASGYDVTLNSSYALFYYGMHSTGYGRWSLDFRISSSTATRYPLGPGLLQWATTTINANGGQPHIAVRPVPGTNFIGSIPEATGIHGDYNLGNSLLGFCIGLIDNSVSSFAFSLGDVINQMISVSDDTRSVPPYTEVETWNYAVHATGDALQYMWFSIEIDPGYAVSFTTQYNVGALDYSLQQIIYNYVGPNTISVEPLGNIPQNGGAVLMSPEEMQKFGIQAATLDQFPEIATKMGLTQGEIADFLQSNNPYFYYSFAPLK